MILSPGSVLHAPLGDLKQAAVEMHSSELSRLEEMECEHVRRAVRGANWKIGGPEWRGRPAEYEADDPGLPDPQA